MFPKFQKRIVTIIFKIKEAYYIHIQSQISFSSWMDFWEITWYK